MRQFRKPCKASTLSRKMTATGCRWVSEVVWQSAHPARRSTIVPAAAASLALPTTSRIKRGTGRGCGASYGTQCRGDRRPRQLSTWPPPLRQRVLVRSARADDRRVLKLGRIARPIPDWIISGPVLPRYEYDSDAQFDLLGPGRRSDPRVAAVFACPAADHRRSAGYPSALRRARSECRPGPGLWSPFLHVSETVLELFAGRSKSDAGDPPRRDLHGRHTTRRLWRRLRRLNHVLPTSANAAAVGG